MLAIPSDLHVRPTVRTRNNSEKQLFIVFIQRKKVNLSIFLLLPLDKQTTVTSLAVFSPSLQYAKAHCSGSREDRRKGSVFQIGTVSYTLMPFYHQVLMLNTHKQSATAIVPSQKLKTLTRRLSFKFLVTSVVIVIASIENLQVTKPYVSSQKAKD